MVTRADAGIDLRPRWRDAGSALPFGLNLTGSTFVNYFHRQLDNVLAHRG